MTIRTLTFAALLVLAPATVAAQQPSVTPAARPATPVPVTGRAKVDGLSIHYEVHGDLKDGRTPLLILHGAYMAGEGMAALTGPLSAGRPVIVIDQRGHGRTGDANGPITYERLADDAAGVLAALDVAKADVLGYSMGGGAAIQLALRNPDRVGKLIPISASYQQQGMYPEVMAGIAQITPEIFAGSPIETEYKRLSPDPTDFPLLVEKLKALDAAPQDWPEAAIAALRSRTFVIVGDLDVVRPEHAVALFRLRGGGDAATAARGMLTAAPPARLAVLPGTSHIGVLARADLIVPMVTEFLDDRAPPNPAGFF